MDKRYKKLILSYYLNLISASCTLFIAVIGIKYEIKILYPLTAAGFVLIFVTGLWVDRQKKGSDWYLPMIIRKSDTVEKLKKDRALFITAAFAFGLVGYLGAKKTDNILFFILLSIYPFFSVMSGLTKEKIEYLENKPEGL